jgi:hypothetical protein
MITPYVIYALKNIITEQYYVGLTARPKSRKNEHFKDLRAGRHHSSKLQAAFNAYGELAFQWKVLQVNIAGIDGMKWEMFWIAHFGSFNHGYNMNSGSEYVGITCTWNGKNYPSQAAAARELKINSSTMRKRVHRGQTCDSDITNPKRAKLVILDNVEYPSLSIAAKTLGVSPSTVHNRLKKAA